MEHGAAGPREHLRGLRDDIAAALANGRGFAAGKLGFSEQCVLRYLPLVEQSPGSVLSAAASRKAAPDRDALRPAPRGPL